MAKLSITIDTIFEGFAPSELFGQKNEYQTAVGIDPDMPQTDGASDTRTGGGIRPVQYSAFSGSAVNSWPIAIIRTPKSSTVYTVLANGRLISYSEILGTETFCGQTATHTAKGAWYYNNYIYIATGGDLARYGPLDGTPTLTESVWTGSTLGTLTALVDTEYPTSLLSVAYLNHHGIAHVDGSAYFLDFKQGQGYVHRVTTKRVTNEGDTNGTVVASAYNVLDLPFNYLPITISSWGQDLVVAASLTKNSQIVQGQCVLFFFNPADTSPTFYRELHMPDAICSALTYINGQLYGTSGQLNSGGYRLFKYLGGDTIETLKIIDHGNPPLQNAIAAIANRIAWAADMTNPMVASGLYAFGSKSDLFPRGLHHIATSGFTN
jgi:hypothetical protein